VAWNEFAARGYLAGTYREKKYLSKGFKTPSGKVELALSRAEEWGLDALPAFKGLPEEPDKTYPLVLTCSKNPRYLHSSYRWVEKLRQASREPLVHMHADTAATYGIEEGDAVVIETRTGEIVQKAKITPAVHPGVIHASYGWWFPDRDETGQMDWLSANYNMLNSMETLGREFGTPNLKGINCRIRKFRDGGNDGRL
jgi:anaerobic selenocysteine-containing dehydrogenase